MSAFAYTPNAWACEWRRGLDGGSTYDPVLREHIYSEKHRDEILAAKNLVRESDLPKGWVEDKMAQKVRYDEWMDNRSDKFKNLCEEHNIDADNPESCADAIAHVYDEWMPAQGILNGEFDKTAEDF